MYHRSLCEVMWVIHQASSVSEREEIVVLLFQCLYKGALHSFI
jgi:hypothetical protein